MGQLPCVQLASCQGTHYHTAGVDLALSLLHVKKNIIPSSA